MNRIQRALAMDVLRMPRVRHAPNAELIFLPIIEAGTEGKDSRPLYRL
jgi:hypothetical protein